jgi:hypothetical protein
MRWGAFVGVVVCALAFSSSALADDWLPHTADATWTYQWTDSAYNTVPTNEKVTVKSTNGNGFTLAWTTDGQGNGDGYVSTTGTIAMQDTASGIDVVSPYWSSNAPPANFPVLCATLGSCPNSLVSTYYNVVWGSLAHVLPEPLLRGTTWTGTGGDSSITSTNTYVGTERVVVPAFPDGVVAAKVRSEVAQAGALGDPYGSGIKTVWWVYGVGPVKVTFQHDGGTNAPVTTIALQSTTLSPKMPPSDVNWFPMQQGLRGTYRWTNAKHLKRPELERFTIDQVANGSARVNVTCVSGQIRCAGLYFLTQRTDGLSSIQAIVKAQSLATFPPLGPRSAPPSQRRHFFTPFDLMVYGVNPVLSEYAKAGDSWSVNTAGRDFAVFGATGTSRVLGVQKVKVPAGRFSAIAVRTTLKQAGYPFGSGTRTSWFAPGRGLVKLVFAHGDGSTSVVELTK